ncbi:TolC family protein [Glaciecola sp. XM2]|uniref:TolC family protein n=1 Tax=Glaciecola sp. XM2 TaxID=1914931 RepID=UPI001BDE3B4A|nr:TolC family protein [Glaciecola sp. XM2]MBT1452078.1 TolC family protein [Glaciecola sp. XM2]
MNRSFIVSVIAFFSVFSFSALAQQAQVLSLQKAVDTALEKDLWLIASQQKQDAGLASSNAALALPDPVVSVSIANLPTDGFAFDQEPMTQLRADISQRFARGDSLSIRQKQLEQLAMQQPYLRENRMAGTKVQVAVLWLSIFQLQESIQLIENDRALFEQLSDLVQASYASALGSVRQHDIVRAQLELTRLEDRLTQLQIQHDSAKAQLSRWLIGDSERPHAVVTNLGDWRVSSELPVLPPISEQWLDMIAASENSHLATALMQHPQILALEQAVLASKSAVELAQQNYKPQFGVNASYAYRADEPSGRSRADFFSVGLSFELPLFTQGAQDQVVAAAISESEGLKTEKHLAVRNMLSELKTVFAQYQGLQRRKALFNDSILVQMREQAEAALNAYENDDGDFAEVMRARIDDLNARIDMLAIETNLLKTQVQMQYYFSHSVAVGADS